MRITAYINAERAAKARSNATGEISAEIDISGYTQEQADMLASQSGKWPSSIRSQSGLYINHYDLGVLDAANLKAFVDDKINQRAEKEAREKARLDAEVDRCRAEIEAGELPFLFGFGALYDIVSQWPEYKALKEAEAARKEAEAARKEAEREAKAKAEAEAAEAAKADMIAWIAAHGSERLRRCVAEAIECAAAYRDERLAAERPGWQWWGDVRGEEKEPRNPPADAFALLDEARKTAPDARLAYVTANAETDDYGDETAPEIRGYACLAEFLGSVIVFGDLWD